MLNAWLDDWRIWISALLGLLVLVIAVGMILRHRLTSMRRRTASTLRSISDGLILDVILPDGIGGHVPVDALLLRDRTLYVLDIRDVEGAIFGSEKMDVWTAMGRRGRYQFNNPLRPMHDRAAAVRSLVPDLTIEPLILFTSRGHFPKGRPEGVQLLEEFAQPLLRPKNKPSAGPDPAVASAWMQLCESAGVPPSADR